MYMSTYIYTHIYVIGSIQRRLFAHFHISSQFTVGSKLLSEHFFSSCMSYSCFLWKCNTESEKDCNF